LTQLSQLLGETAGADMDAVLRVLGEAIDADRLYLIRFDPASFSDALDSTREWCSPGTAPILEAFRENDTAASSWVLSQLGAGDAVLIRALEDLPAEATAEREHLEARGATTAAAVAVR